MTNRVHDRQRARDLVRAAGGIELLERLDHLDSVWASPRPLPCDAVIAPLPSDCIDADVVIAGGGLWSLLAPLLAARGLRVVVLDRAKAAVAHREWNASGPELEALVAAGLVDAATLDRLVVARYDHGTCHFAGGAPYAIAGVLDHAVDAGPLLEHVRGVSERAGVVFLDGHSVTGHASGSANVRVRARSDSGAIEMTAKVMIDARGAASPFATADLVCPTVGGVLSGLVEGDGPDEINPRVGEILATTEGVEDGRQHVWEAFPGRPGQTTVYLFYYALATSQPSLAELYARFFQTLSTYKRGDVTLVRPTFGMIPGWSRLSPAPSSNDPRVLLVGDAASRHSPLTYCGFGATLRSLVFTADAVAAKVEEASLSRREGSVVQDAPIHRLTGALAHMMASHAFRGDELNRLLDAAFRTLYEMGPATYGRLLRDELSPGEFVTFLRKTAARHPAVWGKVRRGLGLWTASRWGFGVAQSMWRSVA